MAALNFQYKGPMMALHHGWFHQNSGTGFVLKPSSLRTCLHPELVQPLQYQHSLGRPSSEEEARARMGEPRGSEEESMQGIGQSPRGPVQSKPSLVISVKIKFAFGLESCTKSPFTPDQLGKEREGAYVPIMHELEELRRIQGAQDLGASPRHVEFRRKGSIPGLGLLGPLDQISKQASSSAGELNFMFEEEDDPKSCVFMEPQTPMGTKGWSGVGLVGRMNSCRISVRVQVYGVGPDSKRADTQLSTNLSGFGVWNETFRFPLLTRATSQNAQLYIEVVQVEIGAVSAVRTEAVLAARAFPLRRLRSGVGVLWLNHPDHMAIVSRQHGGVLCELSAEEAVLTKEQYVQLQTEEGAQGLGQNW